MKRVCFLISGDYHTESRAQKMCHTLSVNGYEVIVLQWDRTAGLPNIEYDGSIKIINIKIKCPHGSGIRAIQKLFKTFPHYFRYLKENSPDVIHCQNFFLWPIALLFGRLFKIKVILDSLEPYAEQKTFNFFKGSVLVRNIFWLIEKRMFRKADIRITVSEGMATRYIAVGSKNVSVILNTPDARFNNVKKQKKNSVFTIGRIGGIDGYLYGIDLLIKAVRYLNNVGVQVKLVLGGPIYAGYDKEFHKLVSRNADCVKYIGVVPYEKVPSVLKGFSCVVNPTQDTLMGSNYGYSVKMFEAMAVGIPIIKTTGWESSKILEKYQCGLLLDYPVTVAKIVGRIKQLIFDPQLCRKLGENGRRAYKTKFNWKVSEETLLKIYGQFLVK
jgi:glycosyltransferase involved in cell wall biosynthesis